ncbi:hypothetical protein GOODEAATRI_016670 [Goodea atripinnis]|uniref:Secreted protein n=1 Tax=Goodea atripinnis TaxID=208336 RepID=A0ABV0PP92_9TELE
MFCGFLFYPSHVMFSLSLPAIAISFIRSTCIMQSVFSYHLHQRVIFVFLKRKPFYLRSVCLSICILGSTTTPRLTVTDFTKIYHPEQTGGYIREEAHPFTRHKLSV